eukprot:5167900-Amphidinium_carterae.2
MGKDKTKAINNSPNYQPPQSLQHNKDYSKGYGKQWSSGYNQGGKKGQAPVQQINDSDYNYYNYEEDPSSWDYSYNQEWLPETVGRQTTLNNCQDKELINNKFVNNNWVP